MENEKHYLNYCGRYIYNSQNNSEIQNNIFRKELGGNFASVERNINIKCKSIKELIKYQKVVNESLKNELEKQQELSNLYKTPYSSSYSVSYKFKDFSTNSENHLLNTKPDDQYGYNLSKIGTLGTYESIKYTCWNDITNDKLIKVLRGENVNVNNQEALALSQIVSLFACESSRNPASFLTAPMSLELAEEEFEKRKTELTKEITNLKSRKQTKVIKDKLTECTDNLDQLNSSKSEIIKEFILDCFPMAMQKAVSASRHISNEVNKLKINKFTHKYDNGRASVSDAKRLDEKTLKVIEKWKYENSNFYEDLNEFTIKWYDISTREVLDMIPDTNLLGASTTP